ncbi:Lipopolysaccharide export system protein LptA [Candidatus Nitrotoga sp. BS]|nr:Lipopolysaccharide export system protein LptA [Candidatus Nitrotoga sp. BS]
MCPAKIKYVALLCLALIGHMPISQAELADRDKPMHLEANQLSIDDVKQISVFEGKVQLTQGTMIINADKIVVTQDKEGFKHGTATGQLASFRQKRDNVNGYVEGYGERIEYDSKTAIIDFFGQARVKQDQDEVRGEHITYNSKAEVFQVNSTSNKGRVRAIIQPKHKRSSVGEPLSIKPTTTLVKPNEQQ